MTDIVPADDIERIVGAVRDPERHIARAVSADQRVYILHSRECFDSGRDLQLCPYSLALDRGIDVNGWIEDEPYYVTVEFGRLAPLIAQTVHRPPQKDHDMHPNTQALLRFFEWQHLPERLQAVSEPFASLASRVALDMGLEGPEQTMALRKLLEAKDCAVRAALTTED